MRLHTPSVRASEGADDPATQLADRYAPVLMPRTQSERCGPGEAYLPIDVSVLWDRPDVVLRTEAASFYTLIRNIGSSVGISVVGALQIYNTDVVRDQLNQYATPDNPNVAAALPSTVDLNTGSGQAIMSGMIEHQAAMVAYVDSFHLLFVMCLVILPFLFLLRTKRVSHA